MDGAGPRSGTVLLGAVVAAVLVSGGIGYAVGSGSGADRAEPAAGSVEAIATELAAGQARERAALSAELERAGRDAHGRLGRVLQQLASAVPLTGDGTAGAAGADGWAAELEAASAGLSAVPEGTTELAVTRGALLGAVELLRAAVAEYARADELPADSRGAAIAAVAERRDAAVGLWQAGAAQLDTVVVDAGREHVHLFLSPDGDPDAVPLEFREPDAP